MSIEAMKQAIEALEDMHIVELAIEDLQSWNKAVKSLRQAIAEAEKQEPKKDLMWSTVAMQERHDKQVESVVASLERIKQERLAELKAEKQEPVAWVDLLKAAEQIVKDKFLYKRFIDGTPLANDIPCWMADFAQQYTHPQPKCEPEAWTPRIERHYKDGVLISQTIQYNPQGEKLPYPHEPKREPLTAEDFLDWYDSAIWGNEDFKECCRIAFEAGWQAAHGIKAD